MSINKEICAKALELGLVKSPTQFWTGKRNSGMTAAEWFRYLNNEPDVPAEDGDLFDDTPWGGYRLDQLPERHG